VLALNYDAWKSISELHQKALQANHKSCRHTTGNNRHLGVKMDSAVCWLKSGGSFITAPERELGNRNLCSDVDRKSCSTFAILEL